MMNDKRVGAAAWLIGCVMDYECGGDWEKLDEEHKEHYRRVAKSALELSDAAAWQQAISAPVGEAIIIGCSDYALPGYRYSSFFKPEWIGLFFSSSSPGAPISPQPTHWQPLPAPPSDAKGER